VIPFLSKRRNFEKLNKENFKNFQCDYAFEFASEGELEYVRYFIDYLLKKNYKIALVYSSESVEEASLNYEKEYSDQVKIFRLDFLGRWKIFSKYRFENYIKAKYLFVSRYDFYPFLLKWGRSRSRKSSLLGFSLVKYYDKLNTIDKIKYKYILSFFDEIYCLNQEDLQILESEFKLEKSRIHVFNLRLNQILDRSYQSKVSLKKKFPAWPLFEKLLNLHTKQNKIICGSYWNEEYKMFNNSSLIEKISHSQKLIVIVPHKIDPESSKLMLSKLRSFFNVYEINENSTTADIQNLTKNYLEHGGIFFVNIKGVLCELYNYFGIAYVGGGFGAGVHSLLEASLAGCITTCGPKINKSPEYFFIHKNFPQQLISYNSFDELSQALLNIDCTSLNTIELNELISYFYEKNKEYMASLEG
jgi:3-deoxy-D-manno-octulosonic-acid transferase